MSFFQERLSKKIGDDEFYEIDKTNLTKNKTYFFYTNTDTDNTNLLSGKFTYIHNDQTDITQQIGNNNLSDIKNPVYEKINKNNK